MYVLLVNKTWWTVQEVMATMVVKVVWWTLLLSILETTRALIQNHLTHMRLRMTSAGKTQKFETEKNINQQNFTPGSTEKMLVPLMLDMLIFQRIMRRSWKKLLQLLVLCLWLLMLHMHHSSSIHMVYKNKFLLHKFKMEINERFWGPTNLALLCRSSLAQNSRVCANCAGTNISRTILDRDFKFSVKLPL